MSEWDSEKTWKECEAKDHIGEPYENIGKGDWIMDGLDSELICPKCATRKKHLATFWRNWFETTQKIKKKERLSKKDISQITEEIADNT